MKLVLNIPDKTSRLPQERAAQARLSVESLILRAAGQSLATPRSWSPRIRLPLVPSRRPGTLRLDSARI